MHITRILEVLNDSVFLTHYDLCLMHLNSKETQRYDNNIPSEILQVGSRESRAHAVLTLLRRGREAVSEGSLSQLKETQKIYWRNMPMNYLKICICW